MKKIDFLFNLPQELIAQYPGEKGESRLLVLHRDSRQIKHKRFPDFAKYLKPGDCLVLNNSKVIPARLKGFRISTGGKVEILLVEKKSEKVWRALVFPGKKAKVSDVIVIDDKIKCTVEEIDNTTGERILRFQDSDDNPLRYGTVPLPPYIKRPAEDIDKKGYQTVYAEKDGSVAAPTAGLHFTNNVLNKLRNKGIEIAEITLHVGPGTFRPVRKENIEDHEMESERFKITEKAASIINRTKRNNGDVFAVGTTTVRALETAAEKEGKIREKKGRTALFIYPPYKFKIVDHLLTNFHMPGSTLIMLVSAFASRKTILNSYREAIKKEYRFYSYGDAMLIL